LSIKTSVGKELLVAIIGDFFTSVDRHQELSMPGIVELCRSLFEILIKTFISDSPQPQPKPATASQNSTQDNIYSDIYMDFFNDYTL